MSLRPRVIEFEDKWAGLSDGVRKVISLEGVGQVSWMGLFEDVYNLCTAHPEPYSEKLYYRLKKFLEEHVDEKERELEKHQADLLPRYLDMWKTYTTGSRYVHHIFLYLNNNWIKKAQDTLRSGFVGYQTNAAPDANGLHDVQTLALVVWRDHIFKQFKGKLLRKLMDLITRERDGEQVQQSLIRDAVQSYVKLGVNRSTANPLEIYVDEFERHFIDNMKEYYAREGTAFIGENGVAAYMKKAEERIAEETERAKQYLDKTSHETVKATINAVLVMKHKEALQVECEPYLRDEKLDELRRMYRLLDRIEDGIKPMLEVLENFVANEGLKQVNAIPEDKKKDPKVYVETLLSVYNRFSDVVKEAFTNDSSFVAALDKAMRRVVNKNRRSPELLAKFCDLLLKKGTKNVEEGEVEEMLGNVITVFKYVDDKDVFQKFYSKMLAKRLIQGTSASDDAEASMIGRLKQACGYEYTTKLQRMFTDVSLSADINDKFRDHLDKKEETTGSKVLACDFNILVLTAGAWPMQAPMNTFNPPKELLDCVNTFEDYYLKQHHGRRLNWLHHLSKGEVRAHHLTKRYEIQATSYQIGLLVAFNSGAEQTYESLAATTKLSDSDLTRNLTSLADSKLILASSMPVDKSTSFKLNPEFNSKRMRIKITTAVQAETKEENEATHKAVTEDRKLFLSAAIVRVMKARKVLNHTQLMQEVIDLSKARFQPSIPLIKKSIETLIEKQYLERVEGEKDKYSYIA